MAAFVKSNFGREYLTAFVLLLCVLSLISNDQASRTLQLIVLFVCGAVVFLLFSRFSLGASETILSVKNAPGRCVLSDRSGKIVARSASWPDVTLSEVIARYAADPRRVLCVMTDEARQKGRSELTLGWRENNCRITAVLADRNRIVWSIDECHIASATEATIAQLTIDEEGRVAFLNDKAVEVLGFKPETLQQFCPDGIEHGSGLQDIRTEAGLRNCFLHIVRGLGCTRDVNILPVPDSVADGDAVPFDRLPVPLLKLSPSGAVILANNAARQLVSENLVPGTQMFDFFEGLGRSVSDWLREASEARGTSYSEFLRLKSDDREVFIQVSLTRVVEGNSLSLIAVLTDATQFKSLEAQFVQSQKMQAIGQLAGGVAHDFNNLLTAITGHCDLLLLRRDQSDAKYNDLVQINQNANRAAALVTQLLAFSRKQNLTPEIVDLRNVLADMTHLLNRLVGEMVSLNLEHSQDLPPIRADKRQLEQVLMNLVVNARDAMPKGGRISLRSDEIEYEENQERDRATVPAGRYLRVRIVDEGTGIAPDRLQKVFEPFYTTKKNGEGTGLGLSTAYGIVKQTGGFIFADSVVGEGTVFSLLFPVFNGAVEMAGTRADVPPSPSLARKNSNGVVLLVEDEAPVRSFAARALKLRGFTVIEAESGEEALEILEQERPEIDLFITDVIMTGVDGPSWVAKAHEQTPDVPVVFMSGYAEESFSDRRAQFKDASFLQKPFSLSDLVEISQSKISVANQIDA